MRLLKFTFLLLALVLPAFGQAVLKGVASTIGTTSLISTAGGAGIALVQSAGVGVAVDTATPTVTLPVAPTNGNKLIGIIVGNTTVSSWTGWTQRVASVDFTGTYIYDRTSDGTESGAIGPTMTGSSGACLFVLEVSGVTTYDVSAHNEPGAGAFLTISTGTTGTTTAAAEFAVVVAGAQSGYVTSWDNSFITTSLAATGTGVISAGVFQTAGTGLVAISVAYRILSSTGTYTSTGTLNASNSNHPQGAIATFK